MSWKNKQKTPETSVKYTVWKQWKRIASVLEKYTGNENVSIRRTKQNRLMISSNCTICDEKKSTFIRNPEPQNVDNISYD